jgi:glycosyltransferase involved in cell wall biosynthesis
VGVVIAVSEDDEHLRACLDSVERHSDPSVAVVHVAPDTASVVRALEELAPADAIVIDEPCRVTDGWVERLRDAAREDTNTATASALADLGTALACCDEHHPPGDFDALAERVAERTRKLRPRLDRAVGPVVYVRREALELVGSLDEELDLCSALELDFPQRCVLAGLAHLAADDVVVQRLQPAGAAPEIPRTLLERYPQLRGEACARRPEASVLAQAIELLRADEDRLWVTLDARALDGAVTGTQVHILELITALAHTGALRLRLLVRLEHIDANTLASLRELPETEILAAEGLDPATPRSTVFHRPQQTFSAGDVALATALGERIVLSQLDLIAYRNPGYFADPGAWEDYRRASRHGLAAAERVIVFSEHTSAELLSDALLDERRITIVPPGLDHRVASDERRPVALDDMPAEALADGFLLCLGTDFQHKNRLFALRLLEALREHHDWQGSLVLAGTHIPHGSSRESERAFLAGHPMLRDLVVELGAVDEREKTWLLAHAGAVVYPSAYEGFGLVPFESALRDVPCVFAPQSSLAESAPHGTATIVPWDPVQSAAAMYALLSDAGARARHVTTLAAAARELTWAAAATATVGAYREAAVAPVRDAATLSRDAAEREQELLDAHQATVRTLIDERELVLRDYDALIEELGPGRGLVGPDGALPESLQRALLALSARPALSRATYGLLSRIFLAARLLARASRTARGER